MVRFLLRLVGYLLIAAGFVFLVIDGARSIANSGLQYTRLSLVLGRLFGDRIAALQPAIERNLHPMLWDPVIVTILILPVAAVACAAGFLLLWLGRPPAPVIGIVTRR